jgi:RNA polymerase sigma factor for flagellar operon FliA
LIQSQEQLVLDHRNLVRFIVRGIYPRISPYFKRKDVISIGTIGLVKAARSYDASKGASFKTYAFIRIRGAILDEVRHRTTGRCPDDAKSFTLESMSHQAVFVSHKTPLKAAETEDLIVKLRKCLKKLNPRQKEAIELYFLQDLTMKEVSVHMSICEARVSQLCASALTRLKVLI